MWPPAGRGKLTFVGGSVCLDAETEVQACRAQRHAARQGKVQESNPGLTDSPAHALSNMSQEEKRGRMP